MQQYRRVARSQGQEQRGGSPDDERCCGGPAEVRADLGRQGEARHLESQLAARRHCLRHQRQPEGWQQQQQTDKIGQHQRPRRVLRQHTGQQRTQRGAADICRCRQIRRFSAVAGFVEFGEGGGGRAGDQAGGTALQGARQEQRQQAVADGEHHRCDGRQYQPGQQHRAAADPIGNPPDHQQYRQQDEHIDREQQSQDARRETQPGLIDAIERRRDRGADEEDQEGVPDQPVCRRPGQGESPRDLHGHAQGFHACDMVGPAAELARERFGPRRSVAASSLRGVGS